MEAEPKVGAVQLSAYSAQSERWFQAIVNVAVMSGSRRRRRRQSVHDGERVPGWSAPISHRWP